jgi:WD40 repeat protein
MVTLPRLADSVSDCSWVPDKPQFITSCVDRKRSLCLWSADGELIHDFKIPSRIYGCAISPQTGNFLAFGGEIIYVYHPETLSLLATRNLEDFGFTIVSISKSQSSQYVLLQLEGRLVALCLDTLEVSRIFETEEEAKFIIRASFGGAGNKYIASGSLSKF